MFKRIGSAVSLSLLTVPAFAEVPATVTTALTGAGTDAAVVGAAVLVVLVGIAAFKYIRKAL
jgi:hypothetical protein